MNDVSNLRDTIIPKSDQLNADDLVGGPMNIKAMFEFSARINGIDFARVKAPFS